MKPSELFDDAANYYSLGGLVVGIIVLVVGLIWSIFTCILIGTVLILLNIVALIVYFFHGRYSDDSTQEYISGCGCLLVIIILILALSFNDTRYITKHGKKRHLYKDCPTIIYSDNIRKASELECFFHFRFKDCKRCMERKENEKEKKREMRNMEYEEECEALNAKFGIVVDGDFDYEEYFWERRELDMEYNKSVCNIKDYYDLW